MISVRHVPSTAFYPKIRVVRLFFIYLSIYFSTLSLSHSGHDTWASYVSHFYPHPKKKWCSMIEWLSSLCLYRCFCLCMRLLWFDICNIRSSEWVSMHVGNKVKYRMFERFFGFHQLTFSKISSMFKNFTISVTAFGGIPFVSK